MFTTELIITGALYIIKSSFALFTFDVLEGEMLMEDAKKRRQAAIWVIRVVSVCCLIYLGVRHIGSIAGAIGTFVEFIQPLLWGFILALILNVPMNFIEQKILGKSKLRRAKRPVSIVLALLLVFGIFVGVAVLVVPELIEAVKLIYEIVTGGLEQLAKIEKNADGAQIFSGYISEINIDWLGVKEQLETWISGLRDTLAKEAVIVAGSAVSWIVTGFIGLVFAIYILAQKEKLMNQACRLIRVWLPEKFGCGLIHVMDVYGKTFKLFIAGQATEAIILGVLCMIGMLILRIPYAPMVGALIGVTALIPLVGAYAGTIIGTIMILTVNPFKALVFVIFIIVLQQVEGNAIYPRTVGAKIKLPAIWVFAAVVVGGNLAGVIGLLLGVPVASAAYALIKEATEKREKMLSDRERT